MDIQEPARTGDALPTVPREPAGGCDLRALDRLAGLEQLWRDRARTRAYILRHWERLHRRRAGRPDQGVSG